MNKESLIPNIEKRIYAGVDEILNDDFFKAVSNTHVSKKGWAEFFVQKYNGTAFFVPLLLHASKICESVNPQLSKVFNENYCDEMGIFAGELRPEYAHSTWRKRSLDNLGIVMPEKTEILPSGKKHGEMLFALCDEARPMVVVGALMFLEHWLVFEMRKLIELFERDMPEDFPKDSYDHDKFPLNKHEYWYSHAIHDVWHFQQIREALRSYINELKTEDELQKAYDELLEGIELTITARKALFSKELADKIISL